MEAPLSSSSLLDSAPLGHLFSPFDHPCTSPSLVVDGMEASHRAAQQLQQMHDQQQWIQLDFPPQPLHYVNVFPVVPQQYPDVVPVFNVVPHGQFVPQPQYPYPGFPQQYGGQQYLGGHNLYHRPQAVQQQPQRQQGARARRRLPALPPGVPSLPVLPRQMPPRPRVDTSSSQDYVSTKVGLYTLHERIGDGMYGAVRRATHNITNSEVAVKIIKKSSLRPHRSSLIRIYREIEVQKRLNHPYVLDLLQVMETETNIYLVTELCKGGELFHKIQKHGPLSEKEARKFFSQLVAAVQYIHERKVVHRDIKAENLLIDEFGNAKLADFGFANFCGDDNLLKTYCGSPQYAAPEIFEREIRRYNGPAVDIWCMGVILHVFLIGSTPFEGVDIDEIKGRVLNANIEYPDFVSPDAAHLLNTMLERDVSRRATLEQVAAHRWLHHDEIPIFIQNSITIYNFIMDNIPRELTMECLTELGITEQQFRERAGRYDNVDGMNRLLVKEYRARRLRRVWTDNNTMAIFIAAHVLQSEGRINIPPVITPIESDPIQGMLELRYLNLREDDENGVPWRSYMPGPEDYPYHEFMEEQRKEMEDNARMAQQGTSGQGPSGIQNGSASTLMAPPMEGQPSISQGSNETVTEEALRDDSVPSHLLRSTEIANFIEAQVAQPVAAVTASVDSSQPTGSTSAPSTLSASLNSVAEIPQELRRMPSDVCNRMDALDLTHKRRIRSASQAPLPKRPSLPCLFEGGAERGALRLADPPKLMSERKTFFELMRLKRLQAIGADNGQSSSRLPPPSLPEGGSFDDVEDGRPSA